MNESNKGTAILNQGRSLPIPASSPAGHFTIFQLPHNIWWCIWEATLNFSLRHYCQTETDTSLKRKCTSSINCLPKQHDSTQQQQDQDNAPSLRRQELSSSETTKSSEEKENAPKHCPKPELNEDSTSTNEKKQKASFSLTTCTFRELSVSQTNRKGENFCLYLCQPMLWQLRPSHHVPTLSRANISTHATAWSATSQSWASQKLTYQKKL